MRSYDELLNSFCDAAAHPRALLDRALADGKKAIGCMPYYCPEELIYAAGMVPFGLWGAETHTAEAKRFFPAFICSLLQTTLELGIKGEYDGLSAVMIPISCDSLKCMEANWRYGGVKIPVIPVSQAQNRKTAAGVEFTRSQYRKILERLEEISGKRVTDGDIAAAIELTNAQRAAMRELMSELKKRPDAVKPSARCAIFKSSYFMGAAEHTAAVRELTELLKKMPETKSGVRLVTTGIIADDSGLLSVLDRCGAVIADDQITHESLRFRTDVPAAADPVVGLAEYLRDIEGCPVLFDLGKKRGDMLVDIVKESGAGGVVFVQTKFCDPDEYDYVPLKKQLDQNGIPSILVEVDQQSDSAARLGTQLETFCEIIG